MLCCFDPRPPAFNPTTASLSHARGFPRSVYATCCRTGLRAVGNNAVCLRVVHL